MEYIQPKSWAKIEIGNPVQVRFAHRDALLNPAMADVAVWRNAEVTDKGPGRLNVKFVDSGTRMEVRDLRALRVPETESTQQKGNQKVKPPEPSLIRGFGVME